MGCGLFLSTDCTDSDSDSKQIYLFNNTRCYYETRKHQKLSKKVLHSFKHSVMNGTKRRGQQRMKVKKYYAYEDKDNGFDNGITYSTTRTNPDKSME